jgi:hypothetical protein
LSRSFAASFHIDICSCFETVVVEVISAAIAKELLLPFSSFFFFFLSSIFFLIMPVIKTALTAPIEVPAITLKTGLFSLDLDFLSFSTRF